MDYLRLTEDAAGVSHFADADVVLAKGNFAPPAPPMLVSATEPCQRLVYLILPAGWGGAKHPSPCRQVAFCLSGHLKVTAGDGETRAIGPGGIWRMEDTGGTGHVTHVIGAQDVRLAIVQLD